MGMDTPEIVKAVFCGLIYLGAAIYIVHDPETPANFTGVIHGSRVAHSTPAWMLRLTGCVMLALPVVVLGWAVWWPAGILVGLAAVGGLYRTANHYWEI